MVKSGVTAGNSWQVGTETAAMLRMVTRFIAAVICKPVRPGQCRTRQDSNGHVCDFEAVVLRIDGVEDSGLILRLRVAGLDRHANREQGFKERGWLFHGVDGWRVKRRPVL